MPTLRLPRTPRPRVHANRFPRRAPPPSSATTPQRAVVPWSSPLVRAVAADVRPRPAPRRCRQRFPRRLRRNRPGGRSWTPSTTADSPRPRARASPRAFPVSSSSPAPGSQNPRPPRTVSSTSSADGWTPKSLGEDAVRDLYRHLYRRAADANRRAPRVEAETMDTNRRHPTPSFVRAGCWTDRPRVERFGREPEALSRRLRQSSGGVAECCVAAGGHRRPEGVRSKYTRRGRRWRRRRSRWRTYSAIRRRRQRRRR